MLAGVLFTCLSLLAQTGGTSPESRLSTGAGPTVFRIPFHVERNNQLVTDVGTGELVLLEDGRERDFVAVASRTLPIELFLLFDTGLNIAKSYDPVVFKMKALERLPIAGIAVYGFENLLMPFCPPARDPRELAGAFARVGKFMKENQDKDFTAFRRSLPPPGSVAIAESILYGKTDSKRDGSTALYAAIRAAAQVASAWPGDARRALVVLGRSEMGTRAIRPETLVAVLRQFGIPLYPVAVHVWAPEVNHHLPSGLFESSSRTLMEIAQATGGLGVTPERITPAVLEKILTMVTERLRYGYVAVFRPSPSDAAPVSHHLEVRLRPGQTGKLTGGVWDLVY